MQKINVTIEVSDGDVAEIVAALNDYVTPRNWTTGEALSDSGGVFVTTTAGDPGHAVEGEIYKAPRRGTPVHVAGVTLLEDANQAA